MARSPGCRGPAGRGQGSRTRRPGRRPVVPTARGSAGSHEGRRSSGVSPSRFRAGRPRPLSDGARDELALDRIEGRLRPAGQAELAEDVADVSPGRPFGDAEIRGDLLVAATLPNEPENLELPLGERLDGGRRRPAAKAAGKDPRRRRVEMDLVV